MLLKYASCAIATVLFAGSTALGDDKGADASAWPGFLGPPAAHLSADDLPLVWSPEKNIAWKASVPGYGQSSPVVWQQRVFVSSISGPMKDACHVCAFDLQTGEKLWQRDFTAVAKVENTNYVSKAAPTPVVDDSALIVWFESGNLVAIEHDGTVRWSRNLVEEYGEILARHGLGSSLQQTEHLVFVWVERQDDPYLLAVEKATGKTRWKVAGLGATSWSTPTLLPLRDERHLVLSGNGKLAGFDPQSGKLLWSFDGISGNTVPTPQPVAKGTLLVGATLGRGEESGPRAAESNGMVEVVTGRDGTFNVRFRWRCRRATSSFGSPIVHQGLAYFVNRAGVLYCIDAETGEEVYAERLAGAVWATPLAVGNRIYFAGQSGTTSVVQAGREPRKLAQNRLWPDTPQAEATDAAGSERGHTSAQQPPQVQYAIAAVPGRLLIRTGDTLYCIARTEAPHADPGSSRAVNDE